MSISASVGAHKHYGSASYHSHSAIRRICYSQRDRCNHILPDPPRIHSRLSAKVEYPISSPSIHQKLKNIKNKRKGTESQRRDVAQMPNSALLPVCSLSLTL